MSDILNKIGEAIIATADALCEYPEFFLLIGGGLFLFIYSGAVSIRRLPQAIKVLRQKQASDSGKEKHGKKRYIFLNQTKHLPIKLCSAASARRE